MEVGRRTRPADEGVGRTALDEHVVCSRESTKSSRIVAKETVIVFSHRTRRAWGQARANYYPRIRVIPPQIVFDRPGRCYIPLVQTILTKTRIISYDIHHVVLVDFPVRANQSVDAGDNAIPDPGITRRALARKLVAVIVPEDIPVNLPVVCRASRYAAAPVKLHDEARTLAILPGVVAYGDVAAGLVRPTLSVIGGG